MNDRDPLGKTLADYIQEDNERLAARVNQMTVRAARLNKEFLDSPLKPLTFPVEKEVRLEIAKKLIPTLSQLVLFPNKELFESLRKLGLNSSVFKWFTPIDELLDLLYDLRKPQGAYFPLELFFVISFIELANKMNVEIIETLDLGVKHDRQEESNVVHKGFKNYLRRTTRSKSQKKQKANLIFDELMDDLVRRAADSTEGVIDWFKLFSDASRGESPQIRKGFHDYFAPHHSQGEVYVHFFPLFQLVFKDRELMSKEIFDESEKLIYNGSYHKYQASRVRKILN